MASDAAAAEGSASGGKPAVLIVGGLGYVGRFLALYLHANSLASEVRLVDKQLPELAYLAPEFKDACSRDRFMQADASREQSMSRIFTRPTSDPSSTSPSSPSSAEYDYVFNCGGETRYSQDDEVYKARSHALALTLGRECARRRHPVLVQLSTGMVYKPDSQPRRETDKLKPWHKQAAWALRAEEDLAKIDGLRLVVLRLANVYGPYTSTFLGTALCLARVYQDLGEEMKWLWDKDLRTNTVHVDDVSRACWTAAQWYGKRGGAAVRPVPVFNIVDHGDTSQGSLAQLIHAHFGIETGFQGTIISSFARLHLDSVVDDLNDSTLDPWAELQSRSGAKAGPIGTFVEKELLKDTDLSLDGAKFESETGFTYTREKLDGPALKEVVESYKRMGWWP